MNNERKALPIAAAVTRPMTGEMVIVKRGERGYWPVIRQNLDDPEMTPQAWNTQHGISEQDAWLLLIGSMFGWDESGEWPDWDAYTAFKIPAGQC